MLVLTRRIGQQIVLPGCGVTIDVVNVGKNHVRLGISAPAGMPIHRSEIWGRIREASESQIDVIAAALANRTSAGAPVGSCVGSARDG